MTTLLAMLGGAVLFFMFPVIVILLLKTFFVALKWIADYMDRMALRVKRRNRGH